ncbi:MAG: sulfatase [Bacteroidales bacterium]|nr:sulfatase [Bacteroidales bacterium]
MLKKTFVLAFILCSNLFLNAQKFPNIVFYLVDDQGLLDCSIYGANVVKTPNIQKLAESGMTFNRAFIASPACAPSRAALLTGLMPARNGAEGNHTYPHEGTLFLPKLLQKVGYEVAAFGKIAHGPADQYDYGFDFISKPKRGLASNVEKYFAQRTSDKPLCLMVGDRRPHVPWIAESEYKADEVDLPPYLIDTKETREHRARYYTDIEGLDAELGQVYELAKKQLGEDFIFIYTSDHGGQWPFGKWNLYDAGIRTPLVISWKGNIKANTRTDAMVSWIDIFPTLLDIIGVETPNNLDGESFNGVLTGKDNAHREYIYTTHTGDVNMNVYPIRSIRSDKFKYIMNVLPYCYHTNHSDILRKDGAGAYWDSWDSIAKIDTKAAETISKYYIRPPEEFYDIINDPNEQNNLVNDCNYKKEIAKMKHLLEDWMKQQGDELRLNHKPYYLYNDRPTPESVKGKKM